MFVKIILFISVVSIPLYSSEYSGYGYTSVYECTDVKDSNYTIFINIDYNSLHFKYTPKDKTIFLFDYNETIETNGLLKHYFTHDIYSFGVYQNPKDPINIYLKDYKDKKIRYEYNCTYDQALKQPYSGGSKIPITWREISKNSKKTLKQTAKLVAKPKITNDNKQQRFYRENLDMYAFCAASYYVRAIMPKKNKVRSKLIYSYASQSRYIASLYFYKTYKKTASIGKISDYREKHLLLLEKEFREGRKLSKKTLQKIAQCDGSIVYFSNNPIVFSDIDKSFMSSEKSDKLFHNELAITTQKLAEIDEKRILESFKVWIEDYNGITPEKSHKKLKKQAGY